MSFRSFTKQFATVLMRDTTLEPSPETCQQALEISGLQEWRIGKSQVLLKPWHLSQLKEQVALYETSARKLQQAFRRNFLRRQSNQQKLFDVETIPEVPPCTAIAPPHHHSLTTNPFYPPVDDSIRRLSGPSGG